MPRPKVLYNELDQWRDAETKRIKQAEVGERRKLALRELLLKETRLLQTIDRLKITAAHEGKVRLGAVWNDPYTNNIPKESVVRAREWVVRSMKGFKDTEKNNL